MTYKYNIKSNLKLLFPYVLVGIMLIFAISSFFFFFAISYCSNAWYFIVFIIALFFFLVKLINQEVVNFFKFSQTKRSVLSAPLPFRSRNYFFFFFLNSFIPFVEPPSQSTSTPARYPFLSSATVANA